MAESEDQRRFDPRQYKFLKLCSQRGEDGIKRWNDWRKRHSDKVISLEGTDFDNCFLDGVYLYCSKDDKKPPILKLTGEVYLKEAHFIRANLSNAMLGSADVRDADFFLADIRNSDFGNAKIEGTSFGISKIDQAIFCGYNVNLKTSFVGTTLQNARLEQGTKQLLEYIDRRRNWERWYEYSDWNKYEPKEHRNKVWLVRGWLVRLFWLMNDYGLSTGRVIFTFFVLAIAFAAIYFFCGFVSPPGIVSNLFVLEGTNQNIDTFRFMGDGTIKQISPVLTEVTKPMAALRALYFSIITMTTLGFGDMYANAKSICGHILLMLQVLLGYVLLGALITRFAVLFTAGGPAGKFADEKTVWSKIKKQTKKLIKSIKDKWQRVK